MCSQMLSSDYRNIEYNRLISSKWVVYFYLCDFNLNNITKFYGWVYWLSDYSQMLFNWVYSQIRSSDYRNIDYNLLISSKWVVYFYLYDFNTNNLTTLYGWVYWLTIAKCYRQMYYRYISIWIVLILMSYSLYLFKWL